MIDVNWSVSEMQTEIVCERGASVARRLTEQATIDANGSVGAMRTEVACEKGRFGSASINGVGDD